jgi:glycerophosphoryl diester phosphodiesterase
MWDRATVDCLRTRPGVTLVLFGIDTAADFALAEALGVDAVMTDSPRAIRTFLAPKLSTAAR